MERLDKILSHAGFGTRKDVKSLLKAGVVCINGEVVKDAAAKVDTKRDNVSVDGEHIDIKENVYLMMNKAQDYVCSTKDGEHETVFACVPEEYCHSYLGGELHLVGRLDIDTEGLLLITTDGSLTHRLTSPKTHCSKKYLVHVRDSVEESAKDEYIKQFAQGVHIASEGDDGEWDCKSAELEWIESNACYLTIYEGRFHQVKRMFKALGNEVVFLKRVAIGELQLDSNLKAGECRELTLEELALLQ